MSAQKDSKQPFNECHSSPWRIIKTSYSYPHGGENYVEQEAPFSAAVRVTDRVGNRMFGRYVVTNTHANRPGDIGAIDVTAC